MTVLLITTTKDEHCTPRLERAIDQAGGRSFRLETDIFPSEDVRLEVAVPGGHRLHTRRGSLDLAQVTAVWNRRFAPGASLEGMDPDHLRVAQREARTMLEGLLLQLPGRVVDPPLVQEAAAKKHRQLELALDAGLEIPRTLITNDPDALRRFADTCPEGLITKMFHDVRIGAGEDEATIYTNVVAPEDLQRLDGLELCPMTFQELIPKRIELRVFAVGRELFAASVDSQGSEATAVDWRRDGVGLVDSWREYQLPEDVEQKIGRLFEQLGLSYGALDMIVTPEGRHVFLEVNPAGEFFWLEDQPGLPISQRLAQLLLEGERNQR